MTDFKEITDSIRPRYEAIGKDTCECGGKYLPDGQALCYSEEDKAMVDAIFTKCEKCGKEKSFTFPIQSAYGQAMAGFMQKLKDLKAKGLSMYSGHIVLEGTPYDENDHFKKEPFTLKCQCYKCNFIFEFHHTNENWRCACPKCDAS